jgi:hypothetical protein
VRPASAQSIPVWILHAYFVRLNEMIRDDAGQGSTGRAAAGGFRGCLAGRFAFGDVGVQFGAAVLVDGPVRTESLDLRGRRRGGLGAVRRGGMMGRRAARMSGRALRGACLAGRGLRGLRAGVGGAGRHRHGGGENEHKTGKKQNPGHCNRFLFK